jgi:hypothetical protein
MSRENWQRFSPQLDDRKRYFDKIFCIQFNYAKTLSIILRIQHLELYRICGGKFKMNNSSNSTTDGQLPVDLDTFLIVSKLISCSVGIPLNLSVVIAVTRHRQLRNRPRNIFLLGISFSYLTFFVPAIIELIDWKLSSIESVCQANVAVIIGPPHALLLLNMSLALIDRYVAINHPVWYREKMTVSLASAL